MVQLIVGAQKFDTPDASDGLALAICHAQNSRGGAARTRALQSISGRRSKKGMSLAESLGLVPGLVGKK
jgi:hypothetical protein